MFNIIFKPILERLPENNRLELIWKLAQIDFKKRFYDNILGLFWALINPLLRVAIYYFVFVKIFNRGAQHDNFALFLFSGLLFWMFFSEGTRKGIKTLQQKKYLIENIQFNRIDLFISSTFSVFLGFMFNIFAYMLASLLLSVSPTIHILLLPIPVINICILVLGISLLLATLYIYIKDIIHIWDLVILLGLWMNPIFYSGDSLREKFPILLYIMPTAGIIDNSRRMLLEGRSPDYQLMLFDFAYASIVLIIGVIVFNKYSHKAAEKM